MEKINSPVKTGDVRVECKINSRFFTKNVDLDNWVLSRVWNNLYDLHALSLVCRSLRDEFGKSSFGAILEKFKLFINHCDRIEFTTYKQDQQLFYLHFYVWDLKNNGSLYVVQWMMTQMDSSRFFLDNVLVKGTTISRDPFEVCFLQRNFDYEVLDTFFKFTGIKAEFNESCTTVKYSNYETGVQFPMLNGSFSHVTSLIPFVQTGLAIAFIRRSGAQEFKFEQIKDAIVKAICAKNTAVYRILLALTILSAEDIEFVASLTREHFR